MASEYKGHTRKHSRTECWNIVLHGKELERFLTDVLPYTRIKRGHVSLGIQFLSLGSFKRSNPVPDDVKLIREALARKIVELNGKRGTGYK